MAGPLIYDDAYAVLCLGSGSRPGRRTVLGPLSHDDAHHGAGKRWEGTRYTCSGCRLKLRAACRLMDLRDSVLLARIALAEARIAFDAFAAVMPVLPDEN